MTKMLADMTAEELAGVLHEMANRVQKTVEANRSTVDKLRQVAQELEEKKGQGHG